MTTLTSPTPQSVQTKQKSLQRPRALTQYGLSAKFIQARMHPHEVSQEEKEEDIQKASMRTPDLSDSSSLTSDSEYSADDGDDDNDNGDYNEGPSDFFWPSIKPKNPQFSWLKSTSSSKSQSDFEHVTPLSSHPPSSLSTSLITIPSSSSTCTSCSSITWEPIVLLPCQDVVCLNCLMLLINAVSNEPKREGDCFACGERVKDFRRAVCERKEDEGGVSTPTKTPSTSRGSGSTFELSPFRTIVWSDTPQTTPPSSNPSPSTMTSSANEIPKSPLAEWSIVRIDNIPWNLKALDIVAWIPPSIISLDPSSSSSSEKRLKVHILCNRSDGRTLNQAYVELPLLSQAQSLVKLKHGKKICGRIVGVSLTRQKELCETMFPGWKFDGIDAINTEKEDPLVPSADFEDLAFLFHLSTSHALKAPERAFLQLVTMVEKVPWHQNEVWDYKFCARLLNALESAIKGLGVKKHLFDTEKEWDFVVTTLINAVMVCPAFRRSQKLKILSLIGMDSHPALDEVPALQTPSPPRHTSTMQSTPSPTPTLTTRRQLPPSPLRFAIRQPFQQRMKAQHSAQEVEDIAQELGVGSDVVKKIMERVI